MGGALSLLAACAADSGNSGSTIATVAGVAGSNAAAVAPGMGVGSTAGTGVGNTGGSPALNNTAGTGAGKPPANTGAAGNPGGAGAGAAGKPGTGGTPATMMMPQTPAGPDDGDPSKPMYVNPEVPCRNPSAGGFGLNGANFKVDNRDLIVDYPCDKHEGAPMTFILNLHGTTPVAQHFYQEGYFSAYKYVSSHNLIIATPSSVVEQWGNGDMGQDDPYLMHIIDWVYKTFGEKLDIRSMWVGGHSWGAFFTAQFGCDARLADKVKGLIIMSGSPSAPACASKVALIDTNAEMDIGPPLDQGMLPMSHGCKAMMTKMDSNNTETFWPDCNPGFVHANYLMLGKMHTDFMDDEVVHSIVDWIKLARQ